MFPIPISKTKIIPPRRRIELLARKRLLDVLFSALDNKLVLVSAPAGYGKTSLLIDAALQSEFKCCWLSLDDLDRDPQRFIAYLVASINEQFPGVGGQTAETMKSIASLEDEMERLAVTLVNEAFASIHEHFVLVLDDFHILEGVQPIYDFLNRFIQLVDDNCHLIISSRTLTTLADLPRMVAREQVSGLSFADLEFRIDEIQALFLQNNNVYLSDEEAQKLIEETEGWITGLQFSGSEYSRKPSTATGVGLFDYLGQQVADRQKPEVRELLLRTSLMDEFDAALCEMVFSPFYKDKQDWDEFIRAIVTNNLFALPVGADGRSLRYHHLFRDYLRQRMKKERADEVKPILESLSRAYESMGEWEKAYAIIHQLSDTNALVELIGLASFNNLQSTSRMIENWLRDLPPSILKNDPRILSVSGTLKLIKGNPQGGIAELTRAIEAFHKSKDIPQLALALVRRSFGYRYLGDYQVSTQDADEAIHLIEDRDDLQSLHAEALHVKGAGLIRLGQNRGALKCFEQALDTLIRLDERRDIPGVLTDIGATYQSLGNYDEAEKTFNRALNIYKQSFNLVEQASLLNNMGNMFHQDGEYEKSASTYESGLLCAQRSQHARLETLISLGIGDLYTELQDFEIAEQNYNHVERMLEERSDIFLRFSLHIGRGNLSLLRGDFSNAENSIQELEQMVKSSQSHYENGYFNLLLGRFHLVKENPIEAASALEQAESHFIQDGLTLESISARVWLAAAYVAAKQNADAVKKMREVLNGKPRHVALIAADLCSKWLEGLQKDPLVGRGVRDLLGRAHKLAARQPDVRREIRRQARVVEVPAAQLIIKGFGNSSVALGGRELILSDWQTQSVRELFFFFLSQPRPLTKEQVAEQFWRELDDPAKVRLRFKNEMYRLRRAVGNEVIRFENNTYFFNRSLNYEYDVEAFESHLARARADEQPEEQIKFYRKAVELVKGPYLDDIYFDWVIADRERLDQLYLAALLSLAELYQKQAQLNEALAMCQRAIEYKPVHESAYRLSMQIHHRMGDRAAVIRTYEACKAALRKHLSLPPSPETDALYKKLIS
jgi:ATP/maltotriose-dependent transcriptional regulator MalT/two-component SAPR family response regulator